MAPPGNYQPYPQQYPPPGQPYPYTAPPPYFGGPPPRNTNTKVIVMVIVLIFVLIMVSMGVFCAWMSAPYTNMGNNQKHWAVTFNDMYYTSRVGRAYVAPAGERYFVVNFSLKNLQTSRDTFTVRNLGIYIGNSSHFYTPATCTDGVSGNFSRAFDYSISSGHNVTGSLCYQITDDGVPKRLSQQRRVDAATLAWFIDASKIRQYINHPPVAKATWDDHGLLNAGSYFWGTQSTDPDGKENLYYNWTVDVINMKANGSQIIFTFDKLGDFTVHLTVTDEYGASSNDTLSITIVDQFKLTILFYGRLNDPGPNQGDIWVRLEMKNLGSSYFSIDSSDAAFYVKDTAGTSHPFTGFNESVSDRCILLGSYASTVWEPYFDVHQNVTPSTLWYFTETSASF